MFPVFRNSTRNLNDPDLASMATFLLGDPPSHARVSSQAPLDKMIESAQRVKADAPVEHKAH
ncbi:hypothetical protein HK44_008580 [Pseudomonas fluorescens HK44]|uniref:Uncharacterized protein n=1 Tax=Pseudomonas fluorescens HK44 TaxID=1042209 RepID=A0A010T9Z1_PSEFL|nr:hypothetical protein HK44_008580 [Pseudomonas fluorescens HK44]